MDNIISIKNKKNAKTSAHLKHISNELDKVILRFVHNNTNIEEVTLVLANRIGELLRIYKKDKEVLLGCIANELLRDRPSKEK